MSAAWIHSRLESARDLRGQPLTHMEQLLLVTSCDSPAGIGASLRTHNARTDTGWTDNRDVGNSILDFSFKKRCCLEAPFLDKIGFYN